MQYEELHESEHEHPGMMPNGYEEEGGTRMLATACMICSRPLRDPASLERGIGPICAQKHDMFVVTGSPDPVALARALDTAPPLMASAVREREGDPRSAVSAAIHAAGRAWETKSSDYAHYVGAAMEIATALGYAGTARALQAVFIEGREFDEEGNPVGRQRPKGIVVRAAQAGSWEIELPYIDARNVWSETNNALKAAGARNQKDQRGAWHTTFPAGDVPWIKILNALVPTMAGKLGVLPSGETFIVPNDRMPVPQPASAQAPVGVGPEIAVQQEPGKLPKDAASLEAGDTVYLKGKPMVVAWISPDRVRTILLTPENAARSMKEKGFLHGKQFGGITAGMRDVVVTPPTDAEVAQVVETTDKPAARAAVTRDMPEQLMPHQREGVLWLLQQGSGLLAFDCGLGKTATAIVAADYPALVICPKSAKENWVREVTMWRPDLTAVRIETGKKREAVTLEAAMTADVTVVNYDILSRYVERFAKRGFKTMMIDESHYIKNFRLGPRKNDKTGEWRTVPTGSARAVTVWTIAQNIPRRICMSGTPMDNKSPCEMFGQLHLVAPNEFPKFKLFGELYCDPKDQWTGSKNVRTYEGTSNLLALHERINGRSMLRKTKELLDLPEKWRRTKLISLDDATAKQYEAAAADVLGYIREQGGWEAMERAEKAKVLVKMSTLTHLTGIGKVEAFIEEVQQHWESTHLPLLIFAKHVDVQHTLISALKALNYRVGAIIGGMSDNQRIDAIDRFQTGLPLSAPPEQRDYYDILVLSIGAAREALNLTRAQDVFFIERTWSPAHLQQAEDRAHRLGQKNKVTITYFDAPGTIDVPIGIMLGKKLSTATAVLGGVEMSKEDVADGIFGSITGGGMTPNQRGAAESYPDWIEPT